MRLFTFDKPKSLAQIRKELGHTCSIPGCGKPLTNMKGPGESTLCRYHQRNQIEYGGMGRTDRPHTFHRSYVCAECGYDSLADPRLAHITDEMTKRRVARTLMHGDHQIRAADGGEDTEENVNGICVVCHAIKTVINEDYKPGKSNT